MDLLLTGPPPISVSGTSTEIAHAYQGTMILSREINNNFILNTPNLICLPYYFSALLTMKNKNTKYKYCDFLLELARVFLVKLTKSFVDLTSKSIGLILNYEFKLYIKNGILH